MIVGSYSSNFYGIPRSTKDADLVVNLDQADWKKLSAILPAGLELEQQDEKNPEAAVLQSLKFVSLARIYHTFAA
jgi:hypothetical protein